MIISVLSHFDTTLGPRVFLNTPEVPDFIKIDHIPILMDFYEEGFFIHSFGEIDTANLIFKVPSSIARGNEEVLMISLVIINEEYALFSFQPILDVFAKELKSDLDAYKAFHTETKGIPGCSEKFHKINNYLGMFYKSLPKEQALFKLRSTKILIFGLHSSGISTIINTLESESFNKLIMESEISIVKVLLGNLSILTYDLSDNKFLNNISNIIFNDIEGIVFVYDASDHGKVDEARGLLHHLNDFPETKNLPLLILLNKIDLGTPNVNKIIKDLEIEKVNCKIKKYYPISALKNENITESFYWLAVEVTNAILRNPTLGLM